MQPEISVICNVYNHEKYLKYAIEGFISQKVNVPIEVLIHDDASTDASQAIIKKYAEKYPDLIKPILQTENQTRQGISVTMEIQIPRAKGRYIAFCEGDDFWTDENKLQLQYDFLEKNKQYSACCHAYNMIDKNNCLMEERFDFDENCVVPIERLIGNQLRIPQLATYVFRRSCFDDLSSQWLGVRCNDMVYRLKAFTQGDLYYLNRNMSNYRRFTENSWTVRIGLNPKKVLPSYKSYIPFFQLFDQYTEGKYHNSIEKELERRKFEILVLEENYRAAKKMPYYKKCSHSEKVKISIGCVSPKLLEKIKSAKKVLKRRTL